MLNLLQVDPAAVSLRDATPADAPRCAEICYEAFRAVGQLHNYPPDFPDPAAARVVIETALADPQAGCVVAAIDGQVVGSNVLWGGGAIAGIGPISVDPSAQNAAIGRRLMAWALERAAPPRFAGVRLVQAAWHARSLSLYTKLGFDAREPLSAVQGAPPRDVVPGRNVRAATPGDRDACSALCLAVHGHDRAHELEEAIARGSARVVGDGRELTGYTTGIGFFGHAVGRSNADLQALIAAAPEIAGPGMLVPTRNGELLRWCLAHGLRISQPMTLMSRGLYAAPAGPFMPSVIF